MTERTQLLSGLPATLGNTRTVAAIAPRGDVAWLALPTAASPPIFDAFAPAVQFAGTFTFQPDDPDVETERSYVGETGVLLTTHKSPRGQVTVTDMLPVRFSAEGAARVPHDRLVRVVECTRGVMSFSARCAPSVDGLPASVEVDPNGILFVGKQHTLLLQTEAHLHRGPHHVEAAFALTAGEKRHFVLTWVDGTDPDVKEMQASEPEWDFDGTLDFWLAWGRRCPFQGVQRDYVLKLAARVRTAWLPPSAEAATPPALGPAGERYEVFRALAPLALAIWGWEDDLASILAAPSGLDEGADVALALGMSWLAAAERASLLSGHVFVYRWPAWQARLDDLAVKAAAAAASGCSPESWPECWLLVADGLRAAAELAEELLLAGDAAGWRAAGNALASTWAGERRRDDDTFDALLIGGDLGAAVRAIEAEFAEGGYLQARRRMDRWLLAYDPLSGGHDLLSDARALFLAGVLYLAEPPKPGRVAMPGDLGD